jgi:hypothetical protein
VLTAFARGRCSPPELLRYRDDSVGNRLTEVTPSGPDTYIYDAATRLGSLNGTSYSWDATPYASLQGHDGILLSDGGSAHAYAAPAGCLGHPGRDTYAFAKSGRGSAAPRSTEPARETVNGARQTPARRVRRGPWLNVLAQDNTASRQLLIDPACYLC